MSKNNSINAQVFYALLVSEKSRVPFLFMSAPGMGKSTTVAWFAESRGYALEVLRGNSTSEDEIMGYDVVDEKNAEARSARHLIPDWFGRVLSNERQGKKTLLFIDEITTCTDQVQSALLHLIFERKVHAENLPQDTLVVAAGNYSQSLGTGFGLIPPLMNRFCIYNLIPNNEDIEPFFSRYQQKGKLRVNPSAMISDMLKNSKSDVSEDIMARIQETIENGFFQITKILQSTHEKKIDIKVSDTQDIYGDVKGDDPLRGFISPRTACYVVDASIASYLCFGREGIVNENYKKIIEGLVGLGLTRKNNGEVEPHVLTDTYYSGMQKIVADLEKLDNDKIAEYEKFFNQLITSKDVKKVTYEDLRLILSKIQELSVDSKVASIDRPIEPQTIEKLCTIIQSRSQVVDATKNEKTASSVAGYITHWNEVADTLTAVGTLVMDSGRGYGEDIKKSIAKTKKAVLGQQVKLKMLKKNLSESEWSLIPEFHDSYLKD